MNITLIVKGCSAGVELRLESDETE